ncbi:DUF6228 family protein [Nocardia bovistercoris]|uniref:Uncharacterized protein n=1 Tax=Nocardia bovistercoris TaxID=2785916 RepID=A0A931N1M2_9NOCA|nr:hypothetical protein [Nocardia bovistercoris]
MIDTDEFGELVLTIRSDTDSPQPTDVRIELRAPRMFDTYAIDFEVRAVHPFAHVELGVRTLGGDGLADFLDALAEDFHGWHGARTWHSIDREFMLSAEHHGYVHLRWGLARRYLHGSLLAREWLFETTTLHAAGESIRTLATDMRTFLSAAS